MFSDRQASGLVKLSPNPLVNKVTHVWACQLFVPEDNNLCRVALGA